jgi:hypothetical protein
MMEKLNNIPGKNPFKVPDNYFEDANRKIISATSGAKHAARKINLYDRFRTSLLIAASVTGFILISYTAVKLFTHKKESTDISAVLYGVTTESFINDIDISSIEEDASTLVLKEEGPDVSKKDIIDYLIRENIEISDIYEQL